MYYIFILYYDAVYDKKSIRATFPICLSAVPGDVILINQGTRQPISQLNELLINHIIPTGAPWDYRRLSSPACLCHSVFISSVVCIRRHSHPSPPARPSTYQSFNFLPW